MRLSDKLDRVSDMAQCVPVQPPSVLPNMKSGSWIFDQLSLSRFSPGNQFQSSRAHCRVYRGINELAKIAALPKAVSVLQLARICVACWPLSRCQRLPEKPSGLFVRIAFYCQRRSPDTHFGPIFLMFSPEKRMEPTVRIELTTRALRKRCSTD